MFDKLKKALGGSNQEEIAPKVEEKVEAAPEKLLQKKQKLQLNHVLVTFT